MPLSVGTILVMVQIIHRSIHGNPVFPMTMRNDPSNKGRTAVWKEIIESGVRVKPRSLNKVAGVKIPLFSGLFTYRKKLLRCYLPPNSRLAICINNRTPSRTSHDPWDQSDHAE